MDLLSTMTKPSNLKANNRQQVQPESAMRDYIQQYLLENVVDGPNDGVVDPNYQSNSSNQSSEINDYLKSITTSLDCEEDLKLYKYHVAFSNHYMSVIGINILESLQEVYKGNKYLIRCYRNGQKFFDYHLVSQPHLITVFGSCIVFVPSNSSKQFKVLDVSPDSQKNSKFQDFNSFMKQCLHSFDLDFKPSELFDLKKVVDFKVGYYLAQGDKSMKAIFLTNNEIFIYPFSTNESLKDDKKYQESLKQHKKRLTDVVFELQEKGTMTFENNVNEQEVESGEMGNEQQICRILDFGVAQKKDVQSYEEEILEVVVLQDNNNGLHLFQGKAQGTIYEKLITLDIKKSLKGRKDSKLFLEDAMLLSTQIIVTLIRIQYKISQSNPEPKDEFKFILFSVDYTGNKVEQIQDLEISFKDADSLKAWKSQILIDNLNKNFYIPEFSLGPKVDPNLPPQKYYLGNFDTAKEQEYLDINYSIICDIIGQHVKIEDKESLDNLRQMSSQGTLYSDFLLFDNLLYISHGKFVTIVNLDQFQQSKPYDHTLSRHVYYDSQRRLPSLDNTKCDFANDVQAIVLFDREAKNQDTDKRWKIMVFLKSGEILEIKEVPHNSVQKEASIQEIQVHDLQIGVKGISEFNLVPLTLYNKETRSNEQSVMEGSIFHRFENQTSSVIQPFFLIEADAQLSQIDLEEKKLHLMESPIKKPVELHSYYITTCSFFNPAETRKFQIEQLDKARLIFLNNTIDDQQQLLVFRSEYNHDKQLIKQRYYEYRLNIGQYSNNEGYTMINEEEVPSNLSDIQTCQNVFVSDDTIYFMYPNKIESLTLSSSEVQIGLISSAVFAYQQVFEDKYYYWRQLKSQKQSAPIKSKICFDFIETLSEFKHKTSKKASLAIFKGLYPHINKILNDQFNDQLCAFSDYKTVNIWPLLHKNEIKLRNAGKSKQTEESHVLATQLFGQSLVILYSDNQIREWNVKTGKLISLKYFPQLDLQHYLFHQKIESSKFMLRRKIEEDFFIVSADFQDREYSKIDIKTDFEIDNKNKGVVKVTEYIILELVINGAYHENNLNQETWKYNVSNVSRFLGPCQSTLDDYNYGLYSGDDVSKFIFYFFDANKVIQLHYYNLESPFNRFKEAKLKFRGKQNDSFHFYDHSPNFSTFSFLNQSSKIQIFDTEHFLSLKQLQKSSYSLSTAQQEKLDFQKKEQEDRSKNIQTYLNISSLKETLFISNRELVFINNDNMVLGYDFISQQESFNVTQCKLPNAQDEISLKGMMKIENRDDRSYHLFTENGLIYENKTVNVDELNQIQIERISPNNFNELLSLFNANIDDSDNYEELRCIQNKYKTKIQLMPKSQIGYIFQSLDYLKLGYQSNVHLVHTFNYYQWRTINLIKGKQIKVENLPLQNLKELCYVQLDNGSTLIHEIRSKQMIIQTLLERFQNDFEISNEEFYLPILEDNNEDSRMRGYTVFDYTFNFKEVEKKHEPVPVPGKRSEMELINIGASTNEPLDMSKEEVSKAAWTCKRNKRTMWKTKEQSKIDAGFYFLEKISNYPFGLFKININHLIKIIAKENLEKFVSFLEGRALVPQYLQGVTFGKVENNQVHIFTENKLWQTNEIYLKKKAYFNKEPTGAITLKILDMENLHICDKNSKNSDNLDFLYSQFAEEETMTIFGNSVVKALIEVKWKIVMRRILIFQLIPYTAFMTVLLIYTIRDWSSYLTLESEIEGARVCRILILISVGYFLLLEVIQASQNMKRYVKAFWNYLDLSAFILIIIAEVVLYKNRRNNLLDDPDFPTNEEYVDMIQIDYRVRLAYATSILMLWNRFLYYFRIFRSMGYYIRMLVESCIDVMHFLFILCCVIVAFGHSFLLLGRNNSSGPLIPDMFQAWFDSYLILSVMGQYFGDYMNWYSWLFLLLSSFLINIVLMNMLISIIGTTYNRITDNYKIIMYKDMLHLIQENKYLNWHLCKDTTLRQKYLFMAVPNDDEDTNAPILDKIEALSRIVKLQARQANSSQGKLDLISKINERDRQIQDRLEKVELKMDHRNKGSDERFRKMRAYLYKKQKEIQDNQTQIIKLLTK